MTLMTRALAALLIVTGAAGAFLLHRNRVLGQRLAAEQARVSTLEHTLTATRNSLNVYMERAKATEARAASIQKELTRALQSNPGWRDMPVPDAVYDGLYHDRGRTAAAAR